MFILVIIVIYVIMAAILRMLGPFGKLISTFMLIPLSVLMGILVMALVLYLFLQASLKNSLIGQAYDWLKNNTGISFDLFKDFWGSRSNSIGTDTDTDTDTGTGSDTGTDTDPGTGTSTEVPEETTEEKEQKMRKELQSLIDSYFETTDEALLNRNGAIHTNAFPKKETFERLKNGKYSSSEEWESDFFSIFPKKLEENHMVLLQVAYSHKSFEVKYDLKKDTVVVSLDKGFLSCSFEQKENQFVFGSLEGRVKDLKGFSSLKEMLNKHFDSELEKTFSSTSIVESIAVNNDCKKLQDVVLRTKGLEFLKQLSKSSCFDDYKNVTVNSVSIKKDSIVQSIDIDAVRSVFGFESPEYNSKIQKVSSKTYSVMTSSLYISDKALSYTEIKDGTKTVYSKIQKSESKARNGFTYFQIYDAIKKKRNE